MLGTKRCVAAVALALEATGARAQVDTQILRVEGGAYELIFGEALGNGEPEAPAETPEPATEGGGSFLGFP